MSRPQSTPTADSQSLQGIINRDVLNACIAGKRESQELLYAYFAPRMLGICMRYAHDLPTAEDILQDGFIKVFNKLHLFRYEGSFEGWLKRIFINTAIEHYRKSSSRQFFVEIESANEHALCSKAIDHLVAQDLIKIVQLLPTGYRTVFNLYAIEGYNHREIGELLSISEGTSKSQLARARNTLKRLIKEQRNNERK